MKLYYATGTCKVATTHRGKNTGWIIKGFATTIKSTEADQLDVLSKKLECTTFARPVKEVDITSIIEHGKHY